MAKKRKRVHPLVSAAALAPLAIGLLTPQTPVTPVTSRGAVVSEVGSFCTLPFDSIKQHHPIDDSCTVDGAAQLDTPQSAQNEAKNNFCSTGAPVNIDFGVLQQLQDDAAKPGSGITFGSDGQLPKDRSVLRDLPTKTGALSEGMVVRLAAFVMDAHYSNVSKGESVNCKTGGQENNDIHIVLTEKSDEQDQCKSVTAEMSPHFRPDSWTPDNLNQRNTHLYRFTGQLFFDASHRPCSGTTGSPKRRSIWEVHPVYAVDVCADRDNNCKVDSDENWISLAEQTGEDPHETRLWLPDKISREFGTRSAYHSLGP
jgi:hypothetical protein